MIEDGKHLLNGLRYVDMNMVRAGVAEHPRDWRWCGYDELVGTRRRYRLLDIKQLLRSLDLAAPQDLATLHAAGVDDLIVRRAFKREALWSESLAVGTREYVERIKKELWQRTRFEEECVTQEDQSRARVVREAPVAYTADSGSKPAL
jgi:putative transposase